jgi:hypothetical protein
MLASAWCTLRTTSHHPNSSTSHFVYSVLQADALT